MNPNLKRSLTAAEGVAITVLTGGITAVAAQVQQTGSLHLDPASLTAYKGVFLGGALMGLLAWLRPSPLTKKSVDSPESPK